MDTVLFDIAAGIPIGVAATLAVDAWNLLLGRAFGVRSLDYCLLGRWVRHMPARFTHASIGGAAPRQYECATGWLVHYGIGVALAVAFVLAASTDWLARPTLLPALIYGIATVVFPYFVLQPALGLGIASARSPKPATARVKSLATHAIFGIGIYAGAALLAAR